MRRRAFLRSSSGIASGVVASSHSVRGANNEVAITDFFAPFRSMSQEEIDQAILKCADGLCIEKLHSDVPLGEIDDNSDKVNDSLRRVRFGIRILNEKGITTAIDESMVQQKENVARQTTRYVPLIGSFNRLQTVACEVSNQPEKDSIRRFLYASIAFGLEISLWQSSVPFQMAWRGVRFTANRTFLRYANKGCDGCIALVMSELHWALRAVPYELTSANNIEFVMNEMNALHDSAKTIEAVDWEFTQGEEDVRSILQNNTGFGGAGGGVAPMAVQDSRGNPTGVLFALASMFIIYSIFKN